MKQAFTDYIEAVTSLLDSEKLRVKTRTALAAKLQSYYELARENGASEPDAIHSSVLNMGGAEKMAAAVTLKYRTHLSLGSTYIFAALLVLFFVIMGILSRGEIFTQFKPLTILAVTAAAALFALIASARRFTLQKFITKLSLGGALSGYLYSIFHMYLFYFDASMANIRFPSFVRDNVLQLMLVMIYGFVITLAATAAVKRMYPPADTFVTEIFEEKEFLRISGG
ncbi:MAG: hypothetical protein LBN00_00710 [Oscillospiraceae bacterium]|jgi:hypothetical protein|nr:hypothetical protein [Oscillospiraceae bacterium]